MNVRRANTGDIKKIVGLVNAVFGTDRGCEWFHHVHSHNPTGPSFLYVAEDDNGVIVSYRSVISYTAYHEGSIISCGQLADACTHPDYRGRGIYGRVNEAAMSDFFSEGGDLVYSFPSRSNYEILVRRFRFSRVASVRHLVFPLRSDRWCKSALSFLVGAHSVAFPLHAPGDHGAHVCPASEATYTSTVADTSDAVKFDRSEAFMRWRLSIPGRQYWTAQLGPHAKAVLGRANRHGLRLCTLLSMEADSLYDQRAALRFICSWASRHDFDAVFAWATCPSWAGLISAGFIPAPSSTNLVVRFNDCSRYVHLLRRRKRWHIELLDTDAY
jgi:hypothetical protein